MAFLTGLIRDKSFDDGDAVALGDAYLAEFLEDFTDRQVYCAYAFAKLPITPDVFVKIAADSAVGLVDAELSASYSDVTGFLWVNDIGKIGGHDIVDIFESHYGEYGAIVVQLTPIDLIELAEDAADGAAADGTVAE